MNDENSSILGEQTQAPPDDNGGNPPGIPAAAQPVNLLVGVVQAPGNDPRAVQFICKIPPMDAIHLMNQLIEGLRLKAAVEKVQDASRIIAGDLASQLPPDFLRGIRKGG